MSLNTPQAPDKYDPRYMARLSRELEREDDRNWKRGSNIELVKEVLILRSPNGARWKITVSNAGVLAAVAL